MLTDNQVLTTGQLNAELTKKGVFNNGAFSNISVSRLEDLGAKPAAKLGNGTYWFAGDLQDIADLIFSATKPVKPVKKISADMIELAGLIGDHMHTIEKKLDEILKGIK